MRFPIRDYDLDATLCSGQAFRWRKRQGLWEGVVGNRWVQLAARPAEIVAMAASPVESWDWLIEYLQLGVNVEPIIKSFPHDAAMQQAIQSCRGLRLLRQDPWECLASFILSSTKQIVQIEQIVDLLCRRYGRPIPSKGEPACAFPTFHELAEVSEANLRACKMGFRAPNLLATARMLANGEADLGQIGRLDLRCARAELIKLPGVGPKIADCVLLFAYGFPKAFPIDVWVLKALKTLYFPKRKVTPKALREFAASYFGPNAGFAQQYLFHYMRTIKR